MAATTVQFLVEANKLLKDLYVKHSSSCASYKEAVEALSIKKMPRSGEDDRRQFVKFALACFDVMARSGVDPQMTVRELGRELTGMQQQQQRKRIIVPGIN